MGPSDRAASGVVLTTPLGVLNTAPPPTLPAFLCVGDGVAAAESAGVVTNSALLSVASPVAEGRGYASGSEPSAAAAKVAAATRTGPPLSPGQRATGLRPEGNRSSPLATADVEDTSSLPPTA
mmetsp:Transcript_30067/g.75341  ORF Transcript_30067/g.75341 Transcript_30067/m.75341 type:complete len:123 (+) Transcript_30067:992-1360(+)